MVKKFFTLFASTFISLVPLLVFAPAAHAATVTWDGDNCPVINCEMSTDANWVGDVAPVNGDSIVFNSSADNQTIHNDLSGATFASITFTSSVGNNFKLTGNAFTITNGITSDAQSYPAIENDITFNGTLTLAGTGLLTLGKGDGTSTLNIGSSTVDVNTTVFLYSAITGSGDITNNDAGSTLFLKNNNSAYTGNIHIAAGSVWVEDVGALGTAAGSTTVADGALLEFVTENMGANPTIAEPLVLAGNGGPGFTEHALGAFKCVYGACDDDVTLTLSGPITLTANTTVAPGHVLKLTGALSGNFTIGVGQGNAGQLIIDGSSNTTTSANGTYQAPKVTNTLSDDQSGVPVAINYNETYIITGKRSSISVNEGGTLKGTGTVGSVVVQDGGTLAPGQSPGCINTGNLTFVSGSTYQFEVGGTTACTEYDQTKVTGTVDLGNGTLSLVRYNDFKPAKNQSYTIIDNDSNDAVTGTFNNLAEGATFAVDGYVFKITYKGGDGNDVVLTVQSVPTTPNTGFSLLSNHPFVTLIATSMLAGGIALIARRMRRQLNIN